MSLKGKTLFITGASRGIGHAIGLRAARDGANVAIAAKTSDPHPKLPGTIHTAAEDMTKAGGKGLAVMCDIRDENQIAAAVAKTVETFGGIDILVNNASAISLTGTLETPMKRYDLMNGVNARGTFACSQACLPHLLKSKSAHILNISPHVAYTMAKFGMSLCVLGMHEEFRGKVAVNALWPRTVIDTSAVRNLLGGMDVSNKGRTPEIMADAAYAILTKDVNYTGHFAIDDEVLRAEGVTDLSKYNVVPGAELLPDFFVD